MLLALVGVAIGVAVVVAVDLANASAERAFERANRAVEGIASHRLSAAGGIDEALYTRLKVELGIRDAAPVVSATVDAGGQAMTLMGIDPLSDYRLRDFRLDPGGTGEATFPLFASAATLAALDRDTGDTLVLRSGQRQQDFHVAGLLEAGDQALPERVLVADIAAAQSFLGLAGRLSYIDLHLADDAAAAALRAALPPAVQLVDTRSRNHARFAMTSAFRTNLSALGLLALVIGLFLIYHTVSFQVVRRRSLFGLLRALGLTGNMLVAVLLAEAATLAVIGTTLGLVLGVFLSQFLYAMVTDTIDALYLSLSRGALSLAPWTLLKASALGIGATALAAAMPALAARGTPPRGLMRKAVMTVSPGRWAWLGLAAIALAAIIFVLGGDSLVAAFAALFALILGSAAFAPMVVDGLSRLLDRPASRLGIGAVLAVRALRAYLSRTGVATAALAIAVAASLGVALMIDSFRSSVDRWLAAYLRADIYISSAEAGGPVLDQDLVASLRGLAGVRAVSLGHRMTLDDPVHGPLELFVLETTAEGFAGFQVKHGDTEDLYRRFVDHGAVLVSEPFAHRFDLSPGDDFTLATEHGRESLRVAAVYYDYSSDGGVLTVSPRTFQQHYAPRGYRAASLYLDNDAVVTEVLERFSREVDADGLYARSNRDLREASLKVFDQVFRVTGILRLLAVVVAVTGIVSAWMALQLERGREYATLRAVGVTPNALAARILAETGLGGLAAGLLALPVGLALCLALIHVINLRSFGWSMQTVVDPVLVVQAVALAVGAALLAGLYPALRARRLALAGQLRGD